MGSANGLEQITETDNFAPMGAIKRLITVAVGSACSALSMLSVQAEEDAGTAEEQPKSLYRIGEGWGDGWRFGVAETPG